MLEDSLLLSSPVLELRKIRVQIKLAKDCPKIYGDSGYLHQVFLNLINNSTDAMPRGGELRISLRGHVPEAVNAGPGFSPAPSTGLRHGETTRGDSRLKPGSTVQEVEVILADTGTGMARETLAHIFDPMFTTKQIGTGAGLGLGHL